ncbi:MAG: hypothetical protein QXR30_03760 [Candidatus Woesearchaeota archaeon]
MTKEYLKEIAKKILMVKVLRVKYIDEDIYVSEDSLDSDINTVVVFSLVGDKFDYHHQTFIVGEKVEIDEKIYITFRSINNEFVLFVPYESQNKLRA